MNNLNVLKKNQNSLLLAEAVGWLHNYYKFSDDFLQKQAGKGKNKAQSVEYCLKLDEKIGNIPLAFPIKDLNESSIYNLIHYYKNNSKKSNKPNKLIKYLSRCHNASHFDKQEPGGGKQSYPGTRISSPFGFERDVPDLTKRLQCLPWDRLKSYGPQGRQELRKYLEANFSEGLGDTRRPINEVDLWNWGLLVGSLYKAALAGILLTGKDVEINNLRWRLLSVRLNGLDYILGASRIPDLLARQQIVANALDKVRQLLEVDYPLGSEVYRDENGSVFVVPDIADLLNITDNSGARLRDLITKEFQQGTLRDDTYLRIGGEIQPQLELEQEAWWGQDPEYWTKKGNDELPKISDFLSSIPVLQHDSELMKGFWQKDGISDICTVCGLRPQGYGEKAANRMVCDICEKRRSDRSMEWAKEQSQKTIWISEVADTNGRLALVEGRFQLDRWLDGTLLESLMLIPPLDAEKKEVTSKNPSFSRLRRIWETTRLFWDEVQHVVMEELNDDCCRLKIYLSSLPDLGPFHVYDLALGPVELDMVWVPPQGGERGYLLSASNLSYIACRLSDEERVYCCPREAAEYVKNYLVKMFLQKSRQPVLQNPEAKVGQRKQNLLEGISITEVVCLEKSYAPVIPILAQPRTFMTLVPADKSLKVIRKIKEKYEQEMGKVRDRLPLYLGVVYAGRRTPLRTVLEAGRAMIDRPLCLESGVVKDKPESKGDKLCLSLERDCRTVTWRIPIKMGDGTTDDMWYPYMYLDKNSCSTDPSQRRMKGAKLPLKNGITKECYLIHMADLERGEKVYLWPSTFDFEFLDTNARRYEIYYNEDGRRPRWTRPFYLEDLDRLDQLWANLKQLPKSQLRQVLSTIEATREVWYGKKAQDSALEDEVFYKLVEDTLACAGWPRDYGWKKISQDQASLVEAGVRGELADLAELHMEILKE